MKTFRSIFALSFGIAAAACTSAPEHSNIDLYVNASFISLDDNIGMASAMAVDNARILDIGAQAKLAKSYPSANVIDLGGAAILPGIIDSHVHVRELGMDAIKADLVGVKTAEDMAERLKTFAPNPKAGEWIIGQGWDEGFFGSAGYPDRAALDAAFPNNPVMLESLHGFAGFYNGAALRIAGVDENTPDPKVGNILRRADGTPTGVMLTLAQDLVKRHVPEPDQAQIETAILAGLNKMAAAGVTSIHEAGMTPADVAAFQALADRSELPIRVYGMLNGNDETLMRQWFTRGILDDPDDYLDVRSIKVFYDGSLGSRTALLAEPYSDAPDAARPTERIAPDAVSSLADRAVQNGFQMAVHAIGDEGNNRTLGIYEAALRANPDFDHRWRIEHAQVVLPDYYQRAARSGILSSMQSSHAVGDSPWAEDRVGPDRIQHAYAWQKIRAAGGRLMINSDLPGEPWEPIQTLFFAVNRRPLESQPGDGWYMDEALSVDEALRAMTIENAYGAFQDDALGSLTPGKWADFITLDKNPYEVDTGALKNIRVTGTWVAGKRVKPGN